MPDLSDPVGPDDESRPGPELGVVTNDSSSGGCMKSTHLFTAAAAIAMATATPAAAQYFHGGSHSGDKPHLHTSTKWRECSFQLDPSLTREAWQQFTREAGMVIYFRSLADARPMGRGHFDFSITQWKTGIDDADAAWNDTFVHPDSAHWLFEGSGLEFPGLTARVGVSSTTDVGVFWSRNPLANYGVYAAQLQQSLVRGDAANVSARASYSALYGPDDVGVDVAGLDLLASKTLTVARWTTVSPYAGVSTYVTRSREMSDVVNLANENAVGMQAMVGAVLEVSKLSLAVEYNAASVSSFSMRVGIGR